MLLITPIIPDAFSPNILLQHNFKLYLDNLQLIKIMKLQQQYVKYIKMLVYHF